MLDRDKTNWSIIHEKKAENGGTRQKDEKWAIDS